MPTAAAFASSSSSSSVPIAFQPCVSHNFLPIKLDGNNYQLWRAQIVPLLHSCQLLGFVNGKTQCPAAFLMDEAGELTDTVNPEYDAWIQQDQLILSWLHASLSSTVLATVMGSTSSRQTWESLELRYANKVTADKIDAALADSESLVIDDYIRGGVVMACMVFLVFLRQIKLLALSHVSAFVWLIGPGVLHQN